MPADLHLVKPSTFYAFHRYLDELSAAGLRPATRRSAHYSIGRFARALPVDPFDATPTDVRNWWLGLHLRLAPTTTRSEMAEVVRFYRWAADAGHVTVDPTAGLRRPRIPRLIPRPISEADLTHAVAHAPDRIRPWLVLAACQGLRDMEIAGLQRRDVLDTAAVPTLLVRGKGGHERVLPLSACTLAELAPALPSGGWVFRRPRGRAGMAYTPQQISLYGNRFLHSVGVAATMHQLRHRFATVTYAACRDLRVVQELMGHRDPATTAIYTKWSPACAVDAVTAAALPQPGGDQS